MRKAAPFLHHPEPVTVVVTGYLIPITYIFEIHTTRCLAHSAITFNASLSSFRLRDVPCTEMPPYVLIGTLTADLKPASVVFRKLSRERRGSAELLPKTLADRQRLSTNESVASMIPAALVVAQHS